MGLCHKSCVLFMAKYKRKKAGEAGEKLSAPKLQQAILELFQRHPKKQLNPRQVIKKLGIDNNKDAVQHALEQLAESRQLVALDDFKFKLRAEAGAGLTKTLREGRVDMTRSGAAYIVCEGMDQDVFVGSRYLGNAMHGDIVKVKVWQARGRFRPEGEVVEVVERASEHFVGLIHVFRSFGIVGLDSNQPIDVLVPLEQLNGARDGDKVVVKITQWSAPGSPANLTGEVTAVLGKPGSSDVDMQAILINNGFHISFPKEVMREAEGLPAAISDQEIALRRDFRDVLTFTIDPIDAKDFDDAISLRYLEEGRVEVGVHIADVSHYVKPGSSLDQEAYQRSTSVYLVDRVCPMLPERLSNELCSLRPNEDKLTFSAVFIFDAGHKVVGRWFGKTVIHSDRRFAYEDVQQILETGEGDHAEALKLLNTIAKKLRDRRFRQGSIDFDSEEVRFRLDENGVPIAVYVKERKDAHMLIEDFMLLANREVAALIGRKEVGNKVKIPFVYRVHDEPDMEKVAELARFAAEMGFEMDIRSAKGVAKAYNALVEKARTEPGLRMLAPLAIRTMAKAEYSVENIGHYGLGFSHYAHFTSPIRRYSDVLAHRILERNLGRGQLYQTDAAKLEEQCKHISRQEKRAADAERESIKYKQVEFITKHLGEVFTGVVSGMADFGVFIELLDSRCEGMIPFDRLPESFEFENGRLSIRGRRTGRRLRMGDEINVRITDADLQRRRIEMDWEEGPAQSEGAVPEPERRHFGRQYPQDEPRRGERKGATRKEGSRKGGPRVKGNPNPAKAIRNKKRKS